MNVSVKFIIYYHFFGIKKTEKNCSEILKMCGMEQKLNTKWSDIYASVKGRSFDYHNLFLKHMPKPPKNAPLPVPNFSEKISYQPR